MTEARSRSCPSCRSIGAPNKGCQDDWHCGPDEPKSVRTIGETFAQINESIRTAAAGLNPVGINYMTAMVEKRLAEQRRVEQAEADNRVLRENRNEARSSVLDQLADQAKMSAVRSRQVGGSHYTDMAIQPAEYIMANDLPWAEGTAIKYISRWRKKGGIEDLRKAIHVLEMLIENVEMYHDEVVS